MISDYNTGNFVSNSQNFTLHLSEESVIDDTQDLVSTDHMQNRNNVVVISDSSTDSSCEYITATDPKSTLDSNVNNRKKTEYPRSHLAEISEEEEERFNRPWRMPDNKSSDTYDNKVNVNKTVYISDESIVSSSDINCDGNTKNQTNTCDVERCCKTPASTFAERKIMGKYSTKQTNRIVAPSNATYCSRVFSKLNQFHIRDAQRNDMDVRKFTKKDAQKIFRNIRQAKITYDSPGERKETNKIIDDTIEDTDEDVIHPAVSPRSNKRLMHLDCDVTDTSINDNIIPDSQENLLRSFSMHAGHSLDVPKEEQFHKPLSKSKREQIAKWLMRNSSDSQSDSSCSNVPPSTRNSKDSANSSLERLELHYETPNNRRIINKVQTPERDGKQTPIVKSSDKVIQSITPHPTIPDRFKQKSRHDSTEFKIPDGSTEPPPTADKETCRTNTPNVNIDDCTEILDKLYGKSWRNKANILLPTTEPRKTSVRTMNRAVQTERKPSRKQCYIRDSDSEESESESVTNKIKVIRRKKDRGKQRKQDSFINDESSEDSDKSMYLTALTNPRTSTTKATPKPMPVSASVKRLQMICDSDSEDANHKSNSFKKNLNRKKLLFSDDGSSSTSEFDPGDYIPPKNVYNKETAKTPSKTSKFVWTNKSTIHKSFLASLSNIIPMNDAHPDAKKYRLNYKNNKEALCTELYKLYNEKVFGDKLPQNMPIEWNIRMRGTAGYCYNRKSVKSFNGIVKSSRIVLATKILDTPDRLRDTLIHEMCHAAAWLLNDVSDGHGPFWTAWANKAMKTFPELPAIRRCHDYEIKTKFTYRCTGCGYSIGRHSKSLDVEKKRCGHCYGKFELLINKTTKSGTVQIQTPKKEPSGFALYVKQNYNSVKKDKSIIKHADVMKILSQQFSALKIARKNDSDVPK